MAFLRIMNLNFESSWLNYIYSIDYLIKKSNRISSNVLKPTSLAKNINKWIPSTLRDWTISKSECHKRCNVGASQKIKIKMDIIPITFGVIRNVIVKVLKEMHSIQKNSPEVEKRYQEEIHMF